MRWREALGAGLVAFALRFFVGLSLRAPPVWDGELYDRAAQGLARGLGYSCFMFGPAADPRVPTAYYPVGLPAYLSGFYAVLGPGTLARALAGALAGAAMTVAASALAQRVAAPRSARAAALFVALSPGLVLSAATPMTETLWGALLSGAVALLAADGPLTRARLGLVASLLAAATYVRPQALLLAPLLPLLPPAPDTRRLGRALAVCVAVGAMVAPWTLRNCRAHGTCAVVSTNGAGNFAIGAVPRADGRYLALTAADGCGDVRGEAARARCWNAISRAALARDPRRWLRRIGPKVAHTWAYEAFPAGYLATARPDLLGASGEGRLRAALTAAWGALLALALVALMPTHPRGRGGGAVALCFAALAAVTATHAVFFGGDRYHLSLTPLVAALAARAWRCSPPWRRRAWRWRESSAQTPLIAQDIQRGHESSGR